MHLASVRKKPVQSSATALQRGALWARLGKRIRAGPRGRPVRERLPRLFRDRPLAVGQPILAAAGFQPATAAPEARTQRDIAA